jgi:hypothetical protein
MSQCKCVSLFHLLGLQVSEAEVHPKAWQLRWIVVPAKSTTKSRILLFPNDRDAEAAVGGERLKKMAVADANVVFHFCLVLF